MWYCPHVLSCRQFWCCIRWQRRGHPGKCHAAPGFLDIIGNRHKNPFFQFYRYFLIVIMQNNVSDKKDLQFYRQCPVIAEASDFPRTFPNMSKRSFSPTLIGAYFSLREIRKIPSLSSFNFLI